ncbi:helix-turn-helix domain-containing protein [Paracoccus zhejiangensis]|uniref:XRE family transcriptional regulator n=1 Tax=Paracoccus zhejiangensis TaxID=1077935 RepID=A0A2H5EXW6_9RHOB|nr:helix-turn-helix transcriptional regulator [Paracoccus zhejiangensis]AUH64145.1 XRE family transcriptional regulator [Paracoccus zhejiangensis]
MSITVTGTAVSFGDRLVSAREARRLNQSELARKAGLQPAAIGHFEKGRRNPSFANIRALARALDVSADYLLGTSASLTGATTAFRNEEHLSGADRARIQVMIDALAAQGVSGS